jgi:glycosyltransferase involved in cell wall biosynthesis
MESGITAAYSGVHQIFQIALAAFEMGRLDRFYCSICDGSGRLGACVAALGGRNALINRRCNAITPQLIEEFPWPFLLNRISRKLSHREWPLDWRHANYWFDAHVSQRLVKSRSKVFIGVETCARDSLRVAKKHGMTTVLDCPQAHPIYLNNLFVQAAEDLKLPPPEPSDDPEMTHRKEEELELADFILIFSDVQRRSFCQAGIAPTKLVQIPLWADPTLWFPPPEPRERANKPLKVVFVGQIGLRKGIPYLLEAAAQCGSSIDLTLVGPVTENVASFLARYSDHYTLSPPRHKSELRRLLWDSDLLVLPSLMDTFGFAAMEAMACGLPVIVSENCGVPVPDPSWIVPVMDSLALAERIECYASNRSLCRDHGEQARRFAAQFTPKRYRGELNKLFARLLAQ